jgi:regulator of nucleoside diphosphate kinase
MKNRQTYFYPSVTEMENKYITISDYTRIINHIQQDIGEKDIAPHILHYLYLSIAGSKKYFSEEIPEDVITMNSEFILMFNHKQQKKIRIVYPENVSAADDVSVYSSLGVACLGSREKDQISFYDGTRQYSAIVEKIVFQPEKEKQFYL